MEATRKKTRAADVLNEKIEFSPSSKPHEHTYTHIWSQQNEL